MPSSKKKPKRRSVAVEVDGPSVAALCAESTSCLSDAERKLYDGDLQAARRKLGVDEPAPKNSRWLNAAGLLLLLEGNYLAGAQHLTLALKLPFHPATHLSAAKNLYWAHHLLPEASESNEKVQSSGQALLNEFSKTRAHVEGILDGSADGHRQYAALQDTMAIMVHDLPVQKAVCSHPLYDQHKHPEMWSGIDVATRWRMRYFDVLKRSLTRYLTRDLQEDVQSYKGNEAKEVQAQCTGGEDGHCDAPWHMGQGAYQVEGPYSQKWLSGLVHLELLITDLIDRRVPGDVLEAGCYTGGTAVLLRAALDYEEEAAAASSSPKGRYANGDDEDDEEDEDEDRPSKKKPSSATAPRRLLLADSFEGIPLPRSAKGKQIDTSAQWPVRYAAGIATAKSTLRRYGVLDERVVFVPGYFNESLRTAPSKRYSLIHIDADAYDSVLDALEGSYSKLSSGGHIVIDDFHLPGVRAAVRDFRTRHEVSEPLLPVPMDHVTACATEWEVGGALTIHPLTVAYWTRA